MNVYELTPATAVCSAVPDNTAEPKAVPALKVGSVPPVKASENVTTYDLPSSNAISSAVPATYCPAPVEITWKPVAEAPSKVLYGVTPLFTQLDIFNAV